MRTLYRIWQFNIRALRTENEMDKVKANQIRHFEAAMWIDLDSILSFNNDAQPGNEAK